MLQLGVYYLCIKVIDSETVRDRATFLPERKKKEKEKRYYHIVFTPNNDIKYLKIYQIGANIC